MTFNSLETGNQTNNFPNILQSRANEIMMKNQSPKDQMKLSFGKFHPSPLGEGIGYNLENLK